MKLLEKAEKILNGGEVLLVASGDIFPLQKLASIPQLVLELETYGDLSEDSVFSPNCVKDAGRIYSWGGRVLWRYSGGAWNEMVKNLQLVVGRWAEIAASASLQTMMTQSGELWASMIICPTATECPSSASKRRISRWKCWKLSVKNQCRAKLRGTLC